MLTINNLFKALDQHSKQGILEDIIPLSETKVSGNTVQLIGDLSSGIPLLFGILNPQSDDAGESNDFSRKIALLEAGRQSLHKDYPKLAG